MPLTPRTKAPHFSLTDKDGRKHSLPAPQYTILYFYPKDNTQGCTIEALDFSHLRKEFEKNNTTIIGISGGTDKTKEKFCTQHALSILLLSDSDFSTCKKYKVYGEKKFMGKTYQGIQRTSYILDKNHRVLKVYENVNVQNHAERVLEDIKRLQKNETK